VSDERDRTEEALIVQVLWRLASDTLASAKVKALVLTALQYVIVTTLMRVTEGDKSVAKEYLGLMTGRCEETIDRIGDHEEFPGRGDNVTKERIN
jgi:hypothetical protein